MELFQADIMHMFTNGMQAGMNNETLPTNTLELRATDQLSQHLQLPLDIVYIEHPKCTWAVCHIRSTKARYSKDILD